VNCLTNGTADFLIVMKAIRSPKWKADHELKMVRTRSLKKDRVADPSSFLEATDL
jgi:hypothetical protein